MTIRSAAQSGLIFKIITIDLCAKGFYVSLQGRNALTIKPQYIWIFAMYSYLKTLAKSAIIKRREILYNASHRRMATNALRAIEEKKGKLSNNIISQCDSYAIEYLGGKEYAPWLYVYSAMQGEFKEGWLPWNYYDKVVDPALNGEFSPPSKLRALPGRLLNTDKFPDLIYLHNRTFLEADSYKIISPERAFEILFSERDTVIFKSNSSDQGRGVYFISRDEWLSESRKLPNGAFQSIIEQHGFFDSIFPYPGATIRITTVLDADGMATARAAYLRLGRSNDSSSSRHVQSSTAVRTAIDLNSGMLFSEGCMANWCIINTHPDTNVPFKGLVIPHFDKARRIVEELHGRYPFARCIGWDVIINRNDDIEIMEWNAGNNDIKFSEAMHGPNFSDLISYVKSPAIRTPIQQNLS